MPEEAPHASAPPGKVERFRNRALNLDNRAVFPELPDDSIDLILTDPPYKNYQSNRPVAHRKVKKIRENQFDLPFFLRESARVLKPGRHLYCWCDHYTFPAIFYELQRQRTEAERRRSKHSLVYKNCLVWVKNNHGAGDLRGNFAPQHEFILFAAKGKGVPLRGGRPSNVLFKRRRDGGIEFFKKVSNYRYNHGTTKPVEVLDLLIRTSTAAGELVFDPYAGTMSVGEACLLTGRDYLLVEIDREFFSRGVERLKEFAILN